MKSYLMFLLMGWVCLPFAADKEAPSLHEPLIQNLAAIQQKLSVEGELGVTVYSLKNKVHYVRIRDTALYTPASCLKLLTTGAAFAKLPPNYFPQTTIDLLGSQKGGRLLGRMKVTGGGDPNISARYYHKENTVLQNWAGKIKALGIDTLQGVLEFDDSFFTAPSRPEHWRERHYDRWFGAEVSALSYNDNCFNMEVLPDSSEGYPPRVKLEPSLGIVKIINEASTVPGRRNRILFAMHPDSNIITLTGTIGLESGGSLHTLPIRGPTAYFEAAFRQALKEAGVALIEDSAYTTAKLNPFKQLKLGTVPITNIAEEINQRSQNFYAETSLRLLSRLNGGRGTPDHGISVVKKFLGELQLDTAKFQLFDGSGLSPKNKVSPFQMVRFLEAIHSKRYFQDYLSTLKIPGLHTNSERLSSIQDKIRIKTGYIDPVQGICGYIFTSEKDTLAFSIFLNNYRAPASRAVALVDSLLSEIVHWFNLEEPSLKRARGLYQEKGIPRGYLDRLVYFSKKLEGVPYALGPTGEGRFGDIDNKPLIDLNRFDCVTYIESVMGLALNRNPENLIETMKKIRYTSAPYDFRHRKHFFVEDWVKQGGDYVKLFRFPGDVTEVRQTGKKKFFKLKNLEYSEPDPQTELSYLTRAEALKLMDNWEYGRRFLGVGFVTELDWLWVSHTGFLDSSEDGVPMLRHASTHGNKVRTEKFKDYLLRRGNQVKGVFFFEFVDKPVL